MGSWLQKQASTEHRDEHKKRSVLEIWNFPQSRETRTRRRGLPWLSGKEPICQCRRCRSWLPGPGRSHTLGSNSARAPQLLSRNAETAGARMLRKGSHRKEPVPSKLESSPYPPQPDQGPHSNKDAALPKGKE